MKKNKKGMTLIELLAVIAIIAILFILLIPAVSSAIEKSKISGVQTDLHSYQIAAKSFMADNGGKDITEENFNKHLDRSLQFTSNQSKELNPWKNPYVLEISDDKKSFVIKTQNKDKEPKEYSLTVFKDEEDEIHIDVAGLDGTQKGDSNKEETLTEEQKNTLCESRTIVETDESYFTVVDKDGGVSITDYSADGPKDVVIPCQIGRKDVVDIGAVGSTGAFKEKSITSVVFPNTLKTISNYAFSTNQLTSVTIPKGVTSIGDWVFPYNQLTSATIPDSVTSIGDHTFSGNQLTSVTIPNSVTSIGYTAFSDNQLTSVTIPEGVTIIRSYAFSGNQLTSVTIPNSVTSIEESAFTSNPNAKFYISDSNNSYKTDEKNAGIYTKDGATIILGTQSAIGTNTYNLVTNIGKYAFQDNKITSVTIPNSVKSIKDSAFSYNQLTSVTIPNSVTSIGSSAFQKNQLTSVTIGSGVTSIGYYAFYYNPNLKTVINKSSISNTKLEDDCFNSSPTITN